MGKLRVEGFTLSLDGFGAGPAQDLDNPLGLGGFGLHGWLVGTQTGQKMVFGKDGGSTGVDDQFAQRGFAGIGAEIMGRNMFGPVRGAWLDEEWRGWWGPNPPFHCPVFVLTQFARAPMTMKGGTVFHFVTGGIHEALTRAKAAAGDKDIRLGGGVSTVRQYLSAGLVDEMHIAISPVLLGAGEHLMTGLDLVKLGYKVSTHVATVAATHVVLQK